MLVTFQPPDVPAWLRCLMERRWAVPLRTAEEAVRRGFPSFAVFPYQGCSYAEVVHDGELPVNHEALAEEIVTAICLKQAEQAREILEQLGIELPSPEAEGPIH